MRCRFDSAVAASTPLRLMCRVVIRECVGYSLVAKALGIYPGDSILKVLFFVLFTNDF